MMWQRKGCWLIGQRAARRPALPACPRGRGTRARPARPLRPRLFGARGDRGSSAIELVILAPALIFVSMLVIQFALWLDANHAAPGAAQGGERAARGGEV